MTKQTVRLDNQVKSMETLPTVQSCSQGRKRRVNHRRPVLNHMYSVRYLQRDRDIKRIRFTWVLQMKIEQNKPEASVSTLAERIHYSKREWNDKIEYLEKMTKIRNWNGENQGIITENHDIRNKKPSTEEKRLLVYLKQIKLRVTYLEDHPSSVNCISYGTINSVFERRKVSLTLPMSRDSESVWSVFISFLFHSLPILFFINHVSTFVLRSSLRKSFLFWMMQLNETLQTDG